MTPRTASTVFAIDDDREVLTSIQGPLKAASIRSEPFRAVEKLSRNEEPDRLSCIVTTTAGS